MRCLRVRAVWNNTQATNIKLPSVCAGASSLVFGSVFSSCFRRVLQTLKSKDPTDLIIIGSTRRLHVLDPHLSFTGSGSSLHCHLLLIEDTLEHCQQRWISSTEIWRWQRSRPRGRGVKPAKRGGIGDWQDERLAPARRRRRPRALLPRRRTWAG
jgi:hypothetical protein